MKRNRRYYHRTPLERNLIFAAWVTWVTTLVIAYIGVYLSGYGGW